MGMMSEFKEFIAKGNVVDLAVGVVIGAAFGKIVSALVDGIVMPIISILTGGVNVSDWKFVLEPAKVGADGKETAAAVVIQYGALLQAAINVLVIAFVIFLVVKAYNRLRTPAADAPPPEDVVLLREIRDSLKK